MTTAKTADSVRLQLDPVPSRKSVLDGGWWPRSTDAMAQLPALITALGADRGQITDILLNSAEWDAPHPRRLAPGRGAVRLNWFASQPAGLITFLTDFGRDRFDLLVVPPDATDTSAGTALTAAADVDNNHRAPDLIADIERRRP
jgi:Family of unknown function (DUF5994)